MSKHGKVTDAPYGIRLIATSGEELAIMLGVLSAHAAKHPTLTDQAKEFRAERDEALALAAGWQRSAEKRNAEYVELAQHADSLANQLEAATQQLDRAQRTIKRQNDSIRAAGGGDIGQVQGGRLATPAQQAEFDRKLTASLEDGNQAFNEWAKRNDPEGAKIQAERHRLLGGVADLHPDEDPRDHVDEHGNFHHPH